MTDGAGLLPAPAEAPSRVLAHHLALDAACDRVCQKKGMPGVDGISTGRLAREREARLATLRDALASGRYQPLPLRLASIRKKIGLRTLLVPAVGDRVAQTAAAQWLSTRWNAAFDAASFAYRPGLGVHDALDRIVELRDEGFAWVFDADLRAFFDSIDHDRLLALLARSLSAGSPALGWIESWVRGTVWDGVGLRRIVRGVPQGSPVSPLLANFYLHPFDVALRRHGLKLVRYADDFVVLARTPFELEEIASVVAGELADLGLEINAEKTRLTSFGHGWRFLGAEIKDARVMLPFKRNKTKAQPVFVAPLMPPALRRAWIAGTLARPVAAVFDPAVSIPPPPDDPAPLPPRRKNATALDHLRGASTGRLSLTGRRR
jgi:group II intron reverse transcriptase/maturase